jgi:AcrR family transcriptional regulator
MPSQSASDPSDKTRPGRKARDAYHHGDLRSALIVAAREALETTAPEAISLKSLALRLGVSQPAPYRHFENREALLAAVAADGFRRFAEALLAVESRAPADQRLEQASLAYLAFGRANPGVYRLMFASNLVATSGDAALAEAAAASFQILLDGVAERVPPERVQAIAVWVWATLHGLVMLEAEGLAGGPMRSPSSPSDVVREMIRTIGGPGPMPGAGGGLNT